MPVINIEFDEHKLSINDVRLLAEAIHSIVISATGVADVSVYSNTSPIKLAIDPVDIFVRISAGKVQDRQALLSQIKTDLKQWKSNTGFPHPINITLIPMDWKMELGI